LHWKATKVEESAPLWEKLGSANRRVEGLLHQLYLESTEQPEVFSESLVQCSRTLPSQWDGSNTVVLKLLEVRKAFADVRQLLRDIGSKCQVPVEPADQTELCDLTEAQAGVLLSGVPGAGGNDAIFAIVLSTDVIAELNDVWTAYGMQHGRRIRRLDVHEIHVEASAAATGVIKMETVDARAAFDSINKRFK